MTETSQKPAALIIEDDEDLRESLLALLAHEGFRGTGAGTLEAGRALLEKNDYAVLLLDRNLPDGDGMSFAKDRELIGGAEVVVITGNADVESAVDLMRNGVLDYLTKPADRTRLRSALSNVMRTRNLKAQVHELRDQLRNYGRFGDVVGRSKPMQRVYDMVGRVAPTDASVLIVGESGTGKEVVARTLHSMSTRRDGPLESVNCGAIPETLIESELFGHEKGSFTGADKQHKGFFERADGGTLFLDEITEMPAELQVKLLRVLETGEVQRIGSSKTRPVDVRVLAATNRDPSEAIQDGKMRRDLFYRLAVFPIHLPPLRERRGDVELLAEHFLEVLNQEHETKKRWAPTTLEVLARRPWEGNVRELKNAVQRAFILAEDEIEPETVLQGSELLRDVVPEAVPAASNGHISVAVGETIAEAERKLILATLQDAEGDKKAAAKTLGISLKTLYTRLKVYEASAEARG